MKKCPFCAENIQDEAIKCRFCGELLIKQDKIVDVCADKPAEKPKVKWYFATTTIIIAILSLGPLALPLVWLHPKYKTLTKITISIIIIVITVWSIYMIKDVYRNLSEQMKALGI